MTSSGALQLDDPVIRLQKQVNTLKKCRERLADAKKDLEACRLALTASVPELPTELGGDLEFRTAVARFLYWECPELPAETIAPLVNIPPSLLHYIVGPSDDGTPCDKCGATLCYLSRRDLATRKDRPKSCRGCSSDADNSARDMQRERDFVLSGMDERIRRTGT